MTNITEPIMKVDCIGTETLSDIKAALITAKIKFEDIAKVSKDSDTINAYRNKAIKTHLILEKIKKVAPCL